MLCISQYFENGAKIIKRARITVHFQCKIAVVICGSYDIKEQ